MEKALKKIRAAREVIWWEEPPEAKRAGDLKGAREQGFTRLIYIATKLATLITFINHARDVARGGGVDLATMKKVAVPYLDYHALIFREHYKFEETSEMTSLASGALAGVTSLEDYVKVLEEISIYLNRMHYWVDLQLPWAELGEAFEAARYK